MLQVAPNGERYLQTRGGERRGEKGKYPEEAACDRKKGKKEERAP